MFVFQVYTKCLQDVQDVQRHFTTLTCVATTPSAPQTFPGQTSSLKFIDFDQLMTQICVVSAHSPACCPAICRCLGSCTEQLANRQH